MANRIITVGAYKRAETMSKWLDPGFETKVLKSERGFHIYTGMYKGKPLSVVGTGMVDHLNIFPIGYCYDRFPNERGPNNPSRTYGCN